jgi:RNA polymerase sigma-70 factor (ECF subfamily)
MAGLIESVPAARARADLGAACAQVVSAVAASWPLTWIDGTVFGRYLGSRLDPAIDLLAAIAEMFIADLYLACAVVHGVDAAVTALDRTISTELPPALRGLDSRPEVIDDTLQLLREKLLVATGQPSRLESYSGHGPIGAWLRVSALRLALSARRKLQPALAPDDELAAVLDLTPNAEVKVLAAQLGTDLRAALQAALAAQPARIRSVLRLYYADGHGVEDIGRVYKVHASTVSRWLAKARADILAHTRGELLQRLRASESQIDSLLGHVASLEISLESLLRTT